MLSHRCHTHAADKYLHTFFSRFINRHQYAHDTLHHNLQQQRVAALPGLTRPHAQPWAQLHYRNVPMVPLEPSQTRVKQVIIVSFGHSVPSLASACLILQQYESLADAWCEHGHAVVACDSGAPGDMATCSSVATVLGSTSCSFGVFTGSTATCQAGMRLSIGSPTLALALHEM